MKTIPILTSVSLDGTITVSIEQVGYTYQIDAGFIPEISKLFQYKPWRALNLLKQKAYHMSKTHINENKRRLNYYV